MAGRLLASEAYDVNSFFQLPNNPLLLSMKLNTIRVVEKYVENSINRLHGLG